MTRCKTHTPRAQKGETLAEVLVAMLIVAVSALLLAAMTTAAAGVNLAAHKQDEAFYASMNKAEAMDSTVGSTPGTAVITDTTAGVVPTPAPTSVPVQVYHDGDLTLYKEAP